MPKTPSLNFVEQKRQFYYHDLRVFIYGAEVTKDLTGRLSVSIADRATPATATLTLDNALDKYVFTEHNARGVYGVDLFNKYTKMPKSIIVSRKTKTDAKIDTVGRNTAIEELVEKIYKEEILPASGDPKSFKPTSADRRNLVDKTYASLNDNFFGDKATEETKLAVMREVVKRLGNQQQDTEALSIADDVNTASDRRTSQAASAGPLAAAQAIETEQPSTVIGPSTSSSARNPVNPRSSVPVWDFQVGDIVINKHDTIVIWARNPLDEGLDQWYRVFTGFVNTATETTDNITGKSSINISCYCIRALMRRMRVALNDGYGVIEPQIVVTDPELGVFRDIIRPGAGGRTHFLQGATLEQAVEQVVTGRMTLGVASDVNPDALKSGRVGAFTLGRVLTYPGGTSAGQQRAGVPLANNTDDNGILEEWHTISVFGDRDTVRNENSLVFSTYDDVSQLGGQCYPGGDDDPYAKKLHMLLPNNGSNIKKLHQIAFDSQPTQYNMTNRFDMLNYFVGELDYQFYTSPAGDLLLEFPMYDFLPEDFGPVWEPIFKFNSHLMTTTATDEAAEMPTGVVVTGKMTDVEGAKADPTTLAFMRRSAAFSRTIAARYGIGEFEWVEKNYLIEPELIAEYAALLYQKRLMAASQMSFTAAYRPYLMPNRPILHEQRNRLGLLQTVENSWEIFGEVTNELTTYALRKRIKNADGTNNYRFIATDGYAMSVSYRLPQPYTPKAAPQPDAETKEAQPASGTAVLDSAQNASTANPTQLASFATPQTNSATKPAKKKPAAKTQAPGIDLDVKNNGIDVITNASNPDQNQSVDPSEDISDLNIVDHDRPGDLNRMTTRTKSILRKIVECVKPTRLEIMDGYRDEVEKEAIRRKAEERGELDQVAVNSAHDTGEAFDIRLFDPDTKQRLLSDEQVKKISECANKEGYSCIVHGGSGVHIHVGKPLTGKIVFEDRKGVTGLKSSRYSPKSTRTG